YRLQLHAGFGFASAADLVPYLAELGVSHCYFSPYLKARPGSTHGYDVVAHDRLNPELGSREDYERLCDTLSAHGMGQILDMVPNHVGVMGGENRWWMDVLENGPASSYADFFDIDWEPIRRELQGKVLVPVLGDHYGNVLDSGDLRLVFAEGTFRVEYYEHRFPIDPREYPRILDPGLDRLRERLGEGDEDLTALESLVTAFGNLPGRWQIDDESRTERRRDKELHKQRLADLCARNADLERYLQECLRDFNGAEDYPADAGRLHALLEVQAYRLAHWRVAADEINYRRFFDINDLAALRMENPETFDATHGLVLDLIAEGRLSGLRIDHPDGLYDPAQYFRWIQERVAAGRRQATPGEYDERPLYLVVEKILAGDERLPSDWPVHGTTGYEYAALTDALLVDPGGAEPLSACYRDFVGDVRPLAEEICAAKKLVMRNLLSSELHVLASELSRIAEADPHTRDYTLEALRNALMEIVACFPVYRTYISAGGVSGGDRNQVLKAVAQARRRSQAADLSVFDFVQDVVLTDIAAGKPEPYRARVLRLAMKLQQYTGPVTAKGLEDTAFYRYHRLVSLNDVGGDPERFGLSVDAFHRANEQRNEAWPHAMLAGSTHDSKRSEEVRARLHVLSELPHEWRQHVERWARLNRRFRRAVDGLTVPDSNTEYLFYQTLLGVWPLEPVAGEALDHLRRRIRDYMEKAVREAKVHTAWTDSNTEYEARLRTFTEAVLDPEHNGAFFEDFLPFQRRIARLGLYNSLSQTLLRLTAPGVPDIYQGSELWTFALVDPDNRRPVDFALRRSLLGTLAAPSPEEGERAGLVRGLMENLDDGRAKLYLIRQALGLRRADPDLFTHGDYVPLAVEGPCSERLCAYARTHEGRAVIALAPRLLAGHSPPEAQPATGAGVESGHPFSDAGWESTLVEVSAAALKDALSGVTLHASPSRGTFVLSAAELLRRFPVGLLTSEDTSHD
ncbi:MAG: malto-oligosyltrehalose synthase, partial [Chromatiaceae bacterium]